MAQVNQNGFGIKNEYFLTHVLDELTADKINLLQQLFEDQPITLVKICAQQNVSYYQLQKLAKLHKWKPRSARKRSRARQSAQAKSNHLMLERMRLIANQHIEKLEASALHTGLKSSSSDRDRDARTLRTLIKTIEEINLLSKDMAPNKTNHEAKRDQSILSTEQREELTKRLKALRGKS